MQVIHHPGAHNLALFYNERYISKRRKQMRINAMGEMHFLMLHNIGYNYLAI